jgi:opacity protein-like surface antigen
VKKPLWIVLAFAFVPCQAQDWTLGVASGPFVFGDFAEHTSTLLVGNETIDVRTTISAATRAGLLVDVERTINDQFSVRLEVGGTRSPISAKSSSDNDDPDSGGVSIEVGDMDILTLALPLTWRFNRGGRLRPYVMAGPAWAAYKMKSDDEAGVEPLYEGTRTELGVLAGVGLEWWWTNRLGVRGELTDTYTESPLRESDFRGVTPDNLDIERLHNVHTTVGLRYRF